MRVPIKPMLFAGLFVCTTTLAADVTPPEDVKIENLAIANSLTGTAGDAAEGRKVFANRKQGNCLACHANSDMEEHLFHGEVGPSLDGVATRWQPEMLRTIVVNAKAVFSACGGLFSDPEIVIRRLITMPLTRRQFLTASAVIAAGGLSTLGLPAHASAESVAAVLADFMGDAEAQTGKLTLKTPEIAENGNSVPISVSVESEMTEESYVESVIVLAEGNPNPEVITFHFTPASGKADGATRMRLAKTQNVVAVAKMSDGTVYSDTKNVKVTIGGCGG